MSTQLVTPFVFLNLGPRLTIFPFFRKDQKQIRMSRKITMYPSFDPFWNIFSYPFVGFSWFHHFSSVHPSSKSISKTKDASPQPQPEAEFNVKQLSLQHNKETDDTTASIHDNIIQDNPKPKSPKKTDEEQTMPDVETASASEKHQTISSEKEEAQNTVHDSESNTSLNQEEILAMKRKNLTKAMKRLQKLHKLSTDSRSNHFSDASLDDTWNESVNLQI